MPLDEGFTTAAPDDIIGDAWLKVREIFAVIGPIQKKLLQAPSLQ
jgi:hypothetical protein